MDPTALPAAYISFCEDSKRVSKKMLGSQRICMVVLKVKLVVQSQVGF